MKLSEVLDVIEEFETEWYSNHSSIYTDRHYREFTQAKRDFIKARMEERAKHGTK